MDASGKQALSKAAKLAAIDSEIERIEAELCGYGVLGVHGTLFENAKQRGNDIESVESILNVLVEEKKLNSFELLEDVKSLTTNSKLKAKAKLLRAASINKLLWWELDVGGVKQYMFVDRGTKATFNVCTEEQLQKDEGANYPFFLLWEARGLTPEKIRVIAANVSIKFRK